ncbi:SurA N-terminal domain-containing protein [Dethiobacter alkaliphilus]|uniref:SurA N-terminal domain-containing protein n=1 Tax=Dethiobacter alkaliphilus TaxID=427926 RepID=UPI0022263CA1|nr:SurA N-terminal domain-containing protein [Dethiobacter alkaliphilus]MCW3489129.1 SurA N-terminal domain-containing protein [Dethiobacter alkaliphilus]
MFFRQKRVPTGVLAVLLLAMLVVAGCGGNSAANTVANVNGEEITRAELDAYMNVLALFMPELQQMLESEELRGMIEGEILSVMVQNVVVEQAAKDLGLSVSDEELQAEYEEFRAMMGGMSDEDFQEVLKEYDINEEDLKQSLRADVYVDKLEQHFAADITDEDIQVFIDENPSFGRQPATLELSHILFDEEEEALEARERILAGEDFGDLAVELSQDPTAQNEGHPGYRGYLGEDIAEDTQDFWSDFMEGANNISEDGEVSPPVETQGGWHLIKLHARTPAVELSFEEAREDAFVALSVNLMNQHLDGVFAAAEIETTL